MDQTINSTPSVSFTDAVRDALKFNYCNFQGRACRSQFWWFVLFQFIVLAAIQILALAISSSFFMVIYYLAALALLLPYLGLTWRRLHDTGRAGGWFFISFIPLVGAIILIIWLAQPSQAGPNRFGEEPFAA